MPRATRPLDLAKGILFRSAICLKGIPRSPRFLYTSEKSYGVCKQACMKLISDLRWANLSQGLSMPPIEEDLWVPSEMCIT